MVEDLMINQSQNPPHNPQIWNWGIYFKYRSAVDNNTDEGKKFNDIYDQLALVPEFIKLFEDLFKDNGGRYNVKFVIEEHVYKNDVPTNPEVNAITDGSNPNVYLIKINKQCLIPNSANN